MEKTLAGKIYDALNSIYALTVGYIFSVVIAAMIYMSAFSTTFIDKNEMPYFLPDSPVKNLLVLFFIMTAAALLHVAVHRVKKLREVIERLEQDTEFFRRIRAVLLWGYGAAIALWVLCTQIPADGDQRAILLAAQHIAMGDYSPGGPVTYFYVYNHQLGITLIVYLLNRIFGEFNCLAYQLINAVLIALSLKAMSELGGFFGMKRSAQISLIVLGMLFVPMLFYASFIYGIIPGFLFSLLAIKYEFLYFEKGGWKRAFLSALFIALAVLLKMNNIIFMVGMLIWAALKLLQNRDLKKLVYPAMIAVFFVAQAKIPPIVYENISGRILPEGASQWGWVTMGLTDGERPGWYFNYNEYTFAESGFDTKTQEAWVKNDLKLRLHELWQDKDAARDFFVRKTASQWNEPSFESVVILKKLGLEGENHWPERIISEWGNYRLICILNYLHFAVIAGAALYILLCTKKERFRDSLVFPMIFIGGFVFHLVWESKSQYALQYFALLLPLAVMGYGEAAKRLSRMLGRGNTAVFTLSMSKKEMLVKLAMLVFAVALLYYLFHGTLDSISGDAEKYMTYLASHR